MKYTLEHIAYLREGYKLMNLADLTDAFNGEFKLFKSQSQIKATLKNHKLTFKKPMKPKKHGMLSLEQHYFLRELYKLLPVLPLTKALNDTYKTSFTPQQIKAYLSNHKITSGRTGRFEKGMVVWNSGTKGIMKRNSGTFKKGNVPINTKEIGAERVCSKDNYILIKVDEINPYTGTQGRYRAKHQVLWEQHHNRKVPKGHTVTFLDGDKRNFAIDNLALVNRNLLCRYNQNHAYDLPRELIPTMKNVVELKQTIHEKSALLNKKQSHREQS